ncbi:MAG: TonB-dependent receptor plug domain-containing protein [Bacteroidetes bacterium]|nr:TonB-dependent receptor plug domain-containing protein [Bacteroidota bacterium]
MSKYFLLFILLMFWCAFSDAFSNTISYPLDSLNTTTIKDNKTIVDTIIPLHSSFLYLKSNTISKNQIKQIDYRYTGDFLKKSAFNYTIDFGFIGQPNVSVLYGVGQNGINFMQDGILINNRYSNFSDLNNIQSEIIDSIEIVPYPRGFLYGPYNNPVSVNFISKDFVTTVAYSKIKYYQGPDGEALADVYFNSMISERINFSFDITNRKKDDKYFNSNYSYWQGTFKLKYLSSNKFNIVGTYNIEKSIIGLNGGVDTDSISTITSNIDSLLYDAVFAPVRFVDRSKEFRTHNFNVILLTKFSNSLKSDISLYYRFSNERIAQTNNTPLLNSTNNEKLYGFIFNNKFENEVFNLNFLTGYESTDIISDSTLNLITVNRSFHSANYFASLILSTQLLRGKITPSIFYKYQHSSSNNINNNRRGFGADLTIKINYKTNIYLGFSSFKNEFTDNFTKNYEARIDYTDNKFIISVGAFFRKDFYQPINIYTTEIFFKEQQSLKGFSAKLNFRLGDFSIENKGEIYNSSSSTSDYLWVVPNKLFASGLYYNNYVFKKNMLLKVGIIFTHNGVRKASYDNLSIATVPSFNRFDLHLSGIIQEVATIYFTWENLTNEQYFIVPYYPMPERNIRFGISWELFN